MPKSNEPGGETGSDFIANAMKDSQIAAAGGMDAATTGGKDATGAATSSSAPSDSTPAGAADIATAAPEQTTQTADSQASEDQRAFLTRFDARTGRNMAEKFRSDEEFIDAIENLSRRMGQREEDAQIGKWFREDPQRFLQEAMAQQGADGQRGLRADGQQGRIEPDLPKDYRDFQLLQRELAAFPDADKAPADLKRRYNDVARKIEEVAFRLAVDPEGLLGPILERHGRSLAEQLVQHNEARLAEDRDLTFLKDYTERNKSWLFEAGDPAKPFTAVGAKIDSAMKALEAKGIKNPREQLELALRFIEVPTLKQPAKPGSHARHKPAVAAQPAEEFDVEKIYHERVEGKRDMEPWQLWAQEEQRRQGSIGVLG